MIKKLGKKINTRTCADLSSISGSDCSLTGKYENIMFSAADEFVLSLVLSDMSNARMTATIALLRMPD
jgi:hypothetical protein